MGRGNSYRSQERSLKKSWASWGLSRAFWGLPGGLLGPSRRNPYRSQERNIKIIFFGALTIPNGMEFFSEGTFLFSYSVRTINDGTEGSPHDGFLWTSWGLPSLTSLTVLTVSITFIFI